MGAIVKQGPVDKVALYNMSGHLAHEGKVAAISGVIPTSYVDGVFAMQLGPYISYLISNKVTMLMRSSCNASPDMLISSMTLDPSEGNSIKTLSTNNLREVGPQVPITPKLEGSPVLGIHSAAKVANNAVCHIDKSLAVRGYMDRAIRT
jgi:hypothetical protein